MKLTEPFVALHEVDSKDSPPDGLTSVFFCGGRKAPQLDIASGSSKTLELHVRIRTHLLIEDSPPPLRQQPPFLLYSLMVLFYILSLLHPLPHVPLLRP
jgi:hypothetical protein